MIHVMMAMALVCFLFAFFPSTAAYGAGLCLISLIWALVALRRRRKAKRRRLFNDPYNLLAVQGSDNERKSDEDAATWLPATSPTVAAMLPDRSA